MRAIKHRELKRMCEQMGPQQAGKHLTEALHSGDLKAEDISIRDWAVATMGYEFVDLCNPSLGGNDYVTKALTEAEGVGPTAFANITGQIIFSKIMDAYQAANLVGLKLVDTVPTRLDGEKIPGIDWDDQTPNEPQDVGAGIPFPELGFGEDYIQTPSLKKFGRTVGVYKETVFFDRTALVLAQAGKVGDLMAIWQEKLIMDGVTGSVTDFDSGGKWKWQGTEYAVYNASAVDWSSYFFVNEHTNALSDYTDIDAALLLYKNMRNPNTREPIDVSPTLTLLVVPNLEATARNVTRATELRTTTGSTIQTIHENPFSFINPIGSSYAYRRLIDKGSVSAANAAKYWWLGDFKKAFAWMENWPNTSRTEGEGICVSPAVVSHGHDETCDAAACAFG